MTAHNLKAQVPYFQHTVFSCTSSSCKITAILTLQSVSFISDAYAYFEREVSNNVMQKRFGDHSMLCAQ